MCQDFIVFHIAVVLSKPRPLHISINSLAGGLLGSSHFHLKISGESSLSNHPSYAPTITLYFLWSSECMWLLTHWQRNSCNWCTSVSLADCGIISGSILNWYDCCSQHMIFVPSSHVTEAAGVDVQETNKQTCSNTTLWLLLHAPKIPLGVFHFWIWVLLYFRPRWGPFSV